MASFVPPEMKTTLPLSVRFDEFTIRELSTDPLCIAEALVGKNFLQRDVLNTVLSHTGKEAQATCLVEAVTNEIKIGPMKFAEFLKVLSELSSTKHIAKHMYSTYQHLLSDCTHSFTGMV